MNYQHLTSIPSLQAIPHTPNPPVHTLMPILISNTAAAPVGTRRRTRRAPAPLTSRHPQRAVDMPRVISLSPRLLFHLPLPPALAQCTMPADLQRTKQTPILSSTPLTQIQVRNDLTATITLFFFPCIGLSLYFEAFTNIFAISSLHDKICFSVLMYAIPIRLSWRR